MNPPAVASTPTTAWRTSLLQAGINVVGVVSTALLWPGLSRWPLRWTQLGVVGGSLAIAAWILVRRHTWTTRAARWSFVLGIAPLFPFLWALHEARAELGHPWSAFETHRLSVFTVALVAPAELWLGAAGIAAFVAAAALQLATWTPTARALVVEPEPWPTVIYGVFALLLLEHRVRQLALERDAARDRADRAALERFARVGLAVRDLTSSPLQTLTIDVELARRGAPHLAPLADRMADAVERLRALAGLLAAQGTSVRWTKETESFDAEAVIARGGEAAEAAPRRPPPPG